MIANNAQYKILKHSGDVMSLGRLVRADYPAMNLIEPDIDFVGLARSLGVEAHRVTEPDALSAHIRAAVDRLAPILLDVLIER